MNTDKYIFQIDPEAHSAITSLHLRNADGSIVEITVDPNDKEFCAFLTWACRHRRSELGGDFARLDPNTEFDFLSCADDVVRYCKLNATILGLLALNKHANERFFMLGEIGLVGEAEMDVFLRSLEGVAGLAHVPHIRCGSLRFFRLAQAAPLLHPFFAGHMDEPPIGARLPVFVGEQLLFDLDPKPA